MAADRIAEIDKELRDIQVKIDRYGRILVESITEAIRCRNDFEKLLAERFELQSKALR